jgi:hypothetical protein
MVVNYIGDEQFTMLLPVFKDYGIIQKLGVIVCDNHTANDKLYHTIAKYFKEEAIEEGAKIERQATFCIMGPLGKLHNIVTHICGSAGCTKEFKDLTGRLIPLDNHTIWNNWYYMLYVALQFNAALNTYTKKHCILSKQTIYLQWTGRGFI